MEPMDIRRVSAILEAVIDAPLEERRRLLRERCGGDGELEAQLEKMIAELEGDSFLSEPVVSLEHPEAARDAGPRRIGPYELLGLLGEGGMGSVYEARQDNPRRLVAVKILRAGHYAGEPLRRFVRESQVLGLLHHPGIAQVFEAGMAETPLGKVPYFAMELIRGESLSAYLAVRPLSVRGRMELLAYICDAVEHAHLHGVVHRDLKPANILVEDAEFRAGAEKATEKGAERGVESGASGSVRECELGSARPKILDFGVARAAAEIAPVGATVQTDAGQIIGTLPYMSPEQVAGSTAIDARSDVYALGVIAYEMLAKRHPIDVKGCSIADATRSILNDEPTRLGVLDTRLAGDVDTIVAKAMEKDAGRRYQTAAGLAADIRRFLRDEPIVARPATRLYQLRKFARRNQAVVIGATATLITLIAGAAMSTFWAIRATDRRELAERRADDLQRKAYRASIAAAQSALDRGLALAAQGHLERTPEVLRGWEWQYLKGQVDRSDRTIDIVGSGFASATLQGSYVFMQHPERPVLRNWMTNHDVACEKAPGVSTAYALAMSPSGDRFALCGELATALWDARSGQLIKVLRDEPRFEASPFTPDGTKIILGAASPRRAMWVNASDGAIERAVEYEGVRRMFPSVSPDGLDLLLEVNDRETALVRLSDDQTMWRTEGGQARFTADGKGVLIYSGFESAVPRVRLLDRRTGEERWTLLLEHVVIANGGACTSVVQMSPDGSMLAYLTMSGSIQLLSTDDLATLGTLSGLAPRLGGTYNGVVFSSDGEWLAGCGHPHTVKVWNVARSAAWAPMRTREELAGITGAIAPDGSFSVVGNWGQIVAWDEETGEPRWAVTPSFEFTVCAGVSWDSARVYIGGDRGTVLALDAKTGEVKGTASPHGPGGFGSGWVSSLGTWRDTSRLMTGYADGTVQVLDAGTLKVTAEERVGETGIAALAVSASGARFACVSDGAEGRVTIGAVDGLRVDHTMNVAGATRVAWSHDESLIAVGYAGGVKLLGADGRERGDLRMTTGTTSCVWFGPDDTRVFAGSAEGQMSAWMTDSGDLVMEAPLPRQAGALAGGFGAGGRRMQVVTLQDATIVYELDKPSEAVARRRDEVRRGHEVYRRAKGTELFLPETIDAIERSDAPAAVKAEAVRQARLLCEHPAWLNNQAYNKTIHPPDESSLRRAIRESDAAIAGSPDPFAKLTRAKVLHRAGRFAEAMEFLRAGSDGLRAVRPNYGDGTPEVSALFGLCEAELGNDQEAERWFTVFDRVTAEPRYKDSEDARLFRDVVAAMRAKIQGRAAPVGETPGSPR